jgi:hypothetical protein
MKRKRFFLHSMLFAVSLAVALILVLMGYPVQAAGNIQVNLIVNRSELTVGDPVELTLEVTHPAGYQVIFPQLEQTWGPFEVQGQSQATTVANNDGTETTYQTVTVTLFDLGTFETPALPLTISDGTGGIIEEVTPPVSLTVVPTRADGDTALKDIRPQAELSLPSIFPMLMAGMLLAAVAAGVGWWMFRRWRSNRPLVPVIDNRPPYQVAFDELNRIDGLGLPDKGRFKEHYTLVTDCLRTYIERQFHVHTFDRTTLELKQSLRQSSMAPDHARHVIDLFVESDLVKFAKLTPNLEVARQATDQARKLVDLTKPALEIEDIREHQSVFGAGQTQKPVEAVQ